MAKSRRGRTAPRIGFIGLGDQGGPMARRIVQDGFTLTVWARRPESLAAVAQTPATSVASPANVGAESDIVCLCPMTDFDVEDLVVRPDGVLAGLSAGGIIAIHSTIHPETCRRIADIAQQKAVSVVDAPVSGGGIAAKERRLLVMVGGDKSAVGLCRPVFESFGDPVIHLGELGSGLKAKIINNFVLAAQKVLALETFELADSLGVDRGALASVLAHGSGGSTALKLMAPGRDLTAHRSRAHIAKKDVGIALDLCAELLVKPPPALADLAHQWCAMLGAPVAQRDAEKG